MSSSLFLSDTCSLELGGEVCGVGRLLVALETQVLCVRCKLLCQPCHPRQQHKKAASISGVSAGTLFCAGHCAQSLL